MRTCISIDNHTWFQLAYCYLHVVMCCDLSTENYGQAKLFSYVFLATGLVPSSHRPFPPVARLFYIYLDTELLIIAHAIKQACMVGNGSLRHRRYCLSIYTRSCTWYANIKRQRPIAQPPCLTSFDASKMPLRIYTELAGSQQHTYILVTNNFWHGVHSFN